MVVTKSELVHQLCLRGYRVSERRITDWVQKALLPGPERGKGIGRAPIYAWPDCERIVDQAEDVWNLLNWHSRVDVHYLPLWYLGGNVPLHLVRPKLLTYFTSHRESMVNFGGTIADGIGCIFYYLTQRGKQYDGKELEMMEMLYNAAFDDGFDPESWQNSELSLDENYIFCINMARYIHENISINKAISDLNALTDEELINIQNTLRHWRMFIGNIIFEKARDVDKRFERKQYEDMLRRVIVLGGPCLLCLEMSYIRRGEVGILARGLDWCRHPDQMALLMPQGVASH